jgi:hypothetical protein
MDNRCRILSIAGVVAALATSCAKVTTKTMVDFNNIAPEIEAISVLPPSFSLGEQGAFSGAALSEANRIIEEEIQWVMERLVEESSVRLSAFQVSDSLLQQDPKLRAALFHQYRALSKAHAEVVSTAGKNIDVEYAADPDFIADVAGADYFLLVYGSGWFATTGAQVKAGIIAGLFGSSTGPMSATALSAMLIDATRAKVLWHASVSKDNKDPRKPRDLLNVAQALMSSLLGKSALKGDKSRDDELTYRYQGQARADRDGGNPVCCVQKRYYSLNSIPSPLGDRRSDHAPRRDRPSCRTARPRSRCGHAA